MALKKFLFSFNSIFHGLIDQNILLASVDKTDESKLKGESTSCQDIERIGAGVHQIQLCQDTNCSLAVGIHFASQFQAIRIGDICICRADGQDDTAKQKAMYQEKFLARMCFLSGLRVWLGYVIKDKSSDLFLNVRRLVAWWKKKEIRQDKLRAYFNYLPIGIFVRPGKSTKVRLRTFLEKTFRWIGSREMPLFSPATRSVSSMISCRTASKS